MYSLNRTLCATIGVICMDFYLQCCWPNYPMEYPHPFPGHSTPSYFSSIPTPTPHRRRSVLECIYGRFLGYSCLSNANVIRS